MSTAGALIVVTVLGVSTHPVRLFAPKPPHPPCPHVSSINHDDNVCHVNNVSSVSSYSAELPQSLMVFFSLGILWLLLIVILNRPLMHYDKHLKYTFAILPPLRTKDVKYQSTFSFRSLSYAIDSIQLKERC